MGAEIMSSFWSWFIIIPVVLGLIGCAWLVLGNLGSKEQESSTPETMGHVWDGDLREYNNPLPRWWFNLFFITLVLAALYLLLYPGLGAFRGVLGWNQIYQYEREVRAAEQELAPLYAGYAATDIEALASDEAAMRTGARMFSTYCSTCHGSDARGSRGFPNLRDAAWLYGGTPDAIETSILNGRNGVMPPWGAVLGETGVEEAVAYVRSLSGADADAALAEAGKAHYEKNCVACHGADGTGNQQLGAPDLTDADWLYGGATPAVVASVRDGRMGQMPAHAERLGEQKVHLLAAYVWSLSRDAEQ